MGIIEEKLKSLINEGNLSIDTLAEVCRLGKKQIRDFLEGNNNLSDEHSNRIAEITIMLTDGMSMVTNDERIKGIIDILLEVYKMDIKAIAYYVGVEVEIIRDFLENTDNVSYEVRYNIATKVSMLQYIFK